jgi:hypothetical protein
MNWLSLWHLGDPKWMLVIASTPNIAPKQFH